MKAITKALFFISVVARFFPSTLSFTVSPLRSLSRPILQSRHAFVVNMDLPSPVLANVDMPVVTVSNQLNDLSPNSIMHQYVQRWSATDASSASPSTTLLSLQEYHKPTAEEIAAKKMTFNLWFWGGGIVAPFLATFYYFGLKFWER